MIAAVREKIHPTTNYTFMKNNLDELRVIGERLVSQDNRLTANPIFQVRGLRRIYGMDPQWCDSPVWIDVYGDYPVEVDPDDTDVPKEELIHTGYVDIWEVLMVSFTEEGCLEHLRLNGHNYQRRYRTVDIYVETLNRCPEMIAIRNFLTSLVKNDEL